MRDPRIALVQMNGVPGDPEANLTRAEELLEEAAGRADLACLPELFDVGYAFERLVVEAWEMAQPVPGGTTVRRLRELAARLDLGLVAGVLERDPAAEGLLYDTTVVIGRSGEFLGAYRKSHLYPREHQLFRSGGRLPVFEVDRLRVGVAICFELAFPPLASTLALQGAQLLLNPSAVPVGYGHLQDVRVRARAQDNQMFVAAVNRVGREGETAFCGGSQVADPRGEVLVKASAEEDEVAFAELDLSAIAEQRRQEPVLRGFRPELYRFEP